MSSEADLSNNAYAEVALRLCQLTEQAKAHPALKTAVVCPTDDVSLEGAASAAAEGLMEPVLVGPEAKIRAAAEATKIDISAWRLIDAPDGKPAALAAVALARDGEVGAIMKGNIHSDELLSAVVSRDSGLRTGRRMSHVFVMNVPTYKWPLLITDAALNIAPDLATKKDIIQNAIYMAHDLGLELPKVAILAATETVSYDMPATMEAAILAKMADRGQIKGAIVDGPLAFDNAISANAAKIKKLSSPVSGQVDILVVPNIETGNGLVKQLVYLAGSVAAGIVLGGRVPVMLTSRADPPPARMASAALAVLAAAGDKARRSSSK